MVIYYNQREFLNNRYKDERIRKKSVIEKHQVAVTTAIFTDFFINMNTISDEVELA